MTAPTAPVAAPVVPVAPVVAPVTPTPAVPSTPETSTVSAMIQKIAQKVVPDPVKPSETAGPTDTVPPITQAPTTEPVADATPTEPPIGSAPTGEVTVDNGEVVMTAERNADGTFKTQIDPTQKFDIRIKDKDTGETKVYSKTVPEMLRMAADGVWGQKVRDEVKYYRENVSSWQQSHATLKADLDAQMALNRELLSAPDETVIARRTEFQQAMSPENQLARLNAQLRAQAEAQQQTQAQQQEAQQANTFIQSQLGSDLKTAEGLVGEERVAEKLALVTATMLVNGRVPPQRWGDLKAYVAGPLQEWAKTEAARTGTAAAQAEQLRRTQVAAQVAVQSAGAAIRPVGGAGPDVAPVTKPKNYQDAIDRIINKPRQASV